MKAICLKQPYASLIVLGNKTLETRTWATKFRGRIAICSSAAPDMEACHRLGIYGKPRGFFIGTVVIESVRPFMPEDAKLACCPWVPDKFAWVLSDPTMGAWQPVKGQLGIFDLDKAIRKAAK